MHQLMHYVTDVLEKPDDPPSRFAPRARPFTTETYATAGRADAFFHVDLTDALALLCLRQNPDRPRSVVSSAGALHRRLAQSPEHRAALEELWQGYRWSRQGEHGEAEEADTPFRVPVFSAAPGPSGQPLLSSRFNSSWSDPLPPPPPLNPTPTPTPPPPI